MKYSVAIEEKTNKILSDFLLRERDQEDLCFALYSVSIGTSRTTYIIKLVVFPEKGDRNLHGNVSFNSSFFDRVTQLALAENLGICFLHSHPFDGWQIMSHDDIITEEMLAPRVKGATTFPLLGMTLSQDGIWSARIWVKTKPKTYIRKWCESVRIVGKSFSIFYHDKSIPPPDLKEEFERTISAWGSYRQSHLSRIRVGIVGLGSVGSQIAEALLRTGIMQISLIDFDIVERRNLDRLHSVDERDIGHLKTEVYARKLNRQKLFNRQHLTSIPYSIVEKEGFEAVLDCDIIFCCVDRPWPRFILNMISASCLIPTIDGGIDAGYSKKSDNLGEARWRSYTVAPGRRCMKCMEQYKSEDVSLEQTGLLDDQRYIKGLERNHFIKHGENVYAFSIGLASMLFQQFLSYILQPKKFLYGPKEMDFVTGTVDSAFAFSCEENCELSDFIGIGDGIKSFLIQRHDVAEISRANAKSYYK
jgi:molybdopterin-synthase adenylyltransferase